MTIIAGLELTPRTDAGSLHELPDYLRPGLRVVIVGFNPSIYSATVGHYYARPTNQFWKCLNESGLLPQGVSLGPWDDSRLPLFGLGLTDVVKRPTRSCNDLRASDYESGVIKLREKLERHLPKVVAFNGKGVFQAYRRFAEPSKMTAEPVELGPQRRDSDGVRAFVLPSTSPINARLRPADKLVYFKRLADWVSRHA
jgi:mismatch-specific thymine-DNA glycosylase